MNILRSLRDAAIAFTLLNCLLLAITEASQSFHGRCLLEVNNKKYLNGPCAITMEDDGSFSIDTPETEPITYFAIVEVTGKDVGNGFWNEEKGAGHAHTPLGNLIRQGACWRNKNAQVCAWKQQ